MKIKNLLLIAAIAAGSAYGYAQDQVTTGTVDGEKVMEIQIINKEDAPPAEPFTLKDINGKNVSLSDFKGQWVILDFWGSWCPWCIKGFPELKETYEAYKGKVTIIGIDCNESEADWKAGVAKYELPWVNVYNPSSSELPAIYGVKGYPTKFIIDPDGLIRNMTVGHDPSFFIALQQLMQQECNN